MPVRPSISEAELAAHLSGICFKTGPPRRTGVEIELLVHDARNPRCPVDPDRMHRAAAALRALPLTSALTFEPGGQLELSSLPATSLTACVEAVSADLARVRPVLRELDLVLAGHGHDPWQPPRRVLTAPRYDAMEAYFDRRGPAGRSMMCRTASVQVCLDAGYEEPGPLGLGRRWLLAHLLGAVLAAAFANSPLAEGRPTGYRTTRQAIWARLDPGRTLAPPQDVEPRTAWARYALDAPVMCVRRPDGPWDAPEGLTFREWARSGVPRPVTLEDLDYHVTTLFPPVRPRGHLELRMIDAQPGPDGWIVPLAVTAALFDDPAAAEFAYRTVKPLAETAGWQPPPENPLWRTAARAGLTDPELHAAAVACFDAAQEALPRLGAAPEIRAAVAEYVERYVARGRCPADDQLDALPAAEAAGGPDPADGAGTAAEGRLLRGKDSA
ncbi:MULTISPECIES: ergothioneine biosynthesis glutamate--cysteine ligase EgtA [unclassified Streptomyces]|uniref:ergothioneine biosynthesis glutamate--cysteine ligase EgtA n=1 Tax=unclassified Streptomyces TaxID=2593676 RepID=UPI0003764D27|nr:MULTISPECIES: ergothioneine biosynthesis glutamate--cysteine ligase EgtA [unclassified Streptomyces]MYT34280.1 ergothioneine biosynthesis glutamate--cysteine ligase EgtA [Streptomyces sp. SID8354]